MLVAWLLEDMLADLGCAVVGPAAGVNQALAMIDAEPSTLRCSMSISTGN